MRKFFILFSRALTLRCPACAGGPLFHHWLQAHAECPGCHLRLERDEGHFIGAMAFNLVVAEGAWVIGLVLCLMLTWPTPPWNAITIGSITAMVLMPIVFYPFSRTLFYAFDLLFQPVERREFPR
jgi:uncharacterized protein (DUF983 family)